MRTHETATVKMAVKRSIRARSIEAGYKSLHSWYQKHENVEISDVLKCFRKWAKRYQNNY